LRSRNLALIGFMAAGKTTIGQAVAAASGRRYIDTDDLIVERAGMSIPDIFAAETESGFRARERAAVAEAVALDGVVIACGGGVARDPDNVAALRTGADILWLQLSAAEATRRILADGRGRPMIDDHVPDRSPEHVLARVRTLLADREPHYRAAADRIIAVDGQTVEQIVAAILAPESAT